VHGISLNLIFTVCPLAAVRSRSKSRTPCCSGPAGFHARMDISSIWTTEFMYTCGIIMFPYLSTASKDNSCLLDSFLQSLLSINQSTNLTTPPTPRWDLVDLLITWTRKGILIMVTLQTSIRENASRERKAKMLHGDPFTRLSGSDKHGTVKKVRLESLSPT